MKKKAQSKIDVFLAVLAKMPKNTTPGQLTARCMEQGVWTKEEDDRLLVRARIAEVRDALNKTLPDGLPAAFIITREIKRDDDGKITKVNIIEQRAVFSKSGAVIWVRERMKALRGDAKKIMRVVIHAKKRWPDIDWDREVADMLPLIKHKPR